MSATPIPRTLEMAITGIREMSTIATPPEERHPVLTYVGVQDDKQIAAAIHRELLRDGQVFYLHNRVESIERAARRLRELVPEARVAVAHGQMGEDALERIMVGFWEKEYDVLVCTTIVESGIDIAEREHADRRAGRPARAVAAAPDPGPGRAAAASGRTRTSSTRRTGRSPSRRTSGWPRSPSTPNSAPACTWR